MSETEYRQRCFAQKLKICNACGTTSNLLAHHLNGDRDDGRLENLIPLCRSCHAKVHVAQKPTGVHKHLREQLPDSSIRFGPTSNASATIDIPGGSERGNQSVPYDEHDENGKFKRQYTDEMVLDAIRELDGRTGTGDIAGALGCSNRLALTRLRSLEEQGDVSGFPIGNTFLWELED